MAFQQQKDSFKASEFQTDHQSLLDQIFLKARTYHAWLNKSVNPELLRMIYEVMKWGPTSANSCPARFVFIQSRAAKEKLLPLLDQGNVEQTRTAPVTVIVAYDIRFFENLDKLFPHMDMRKMFESNPRLAEETAFRNSSMQGAYFIIAARALGLDCGPMSGFDNAKVDSVFLANTSWRSNFICNIGYGDPSKLYPRDPRPTFEEVGRIL